jgi:peptidoglycan LD-endopeptidase LytH
MRTRTYRLVFLFGSLAQVLSTFGSGYAAQQHVANDAPLAPQRAGNSINVPAGTEKKSAPEPKLSPSEWATGVQQLRGMHLQIPLEGFDPQRMKGSYYETRGGQMHEAVDMLAPRSTPIHAVCDGRIAKLFHSRLGGTTIYQFDQNQRFVFYYAHLQNYAEGLTDGETVKKGDVIGYVGTSGNAPPNTSHLHFSISVLGPLKQWWKASPLDPYEVFTKSLPIRVRPNLAVSRTPSAREVISYGITSACECSLKSYLQRFWSCLRTNLACNRT